MPKKLLFIGLSLLFISQISAQSSDELSKTLLQKQNISEENFQQSVVAIKYEDLPGNDTILKYNTWLTDNKSRLLSNQSTFFTVHYFIELALSNALLHNSSLSYKFNNFELGFYLYVPEIFFPVQLQILQY